MTKSELAALLVQESFKSKTYSLEPAEVDEALCLREENGQWCVYYAERGLQTGKKFFSSEAQACSFFLTEMRSDPTTRQGWNSGFRLG
jgi:hypothetical protein